MEPPETVGEYAVLTGRAPVAGMRDYAAEVAAYTRGQGRLFCTLSGYEPCHNAQQVVEEMGYDPERDVEHTPDSVFCTHGAGYVVKWYQVKAQMHVESGLMRREEEPEISESQPRREARYTGSLAEDAELQAIYERTY